MRKRWKRSFVTALSMALAVGNCVPAMAAPAGWRESAAGWQYVNANGSIQKGWFQDTNKQWYFLDYNTGVMKTGWIKPADGKWYFMDYHTGAMKTGWIKPMDGKWYYMNPSNGDMQTGWVQTPDSKWYYLDTASGAMQTGSITVGNQVWTLDANGVWDGKSATSARYVSTSTRRPGGSSSSSDDSGSGDDTSETTLTGWVGTEKDGKVDVTITDKKFVMATFEKEFEEEYKGKAVNNLTIDASLSENDKITVTIKKVEGDLNITDKVGDGTVTLEGVEVEGETTVGGGGNQSVYFNKCGLKNFKTNKSSGSALHIAFGAETTVGEVTIGGGNVILETAIAIEDLVVNSPIVVKGTGRIKNFNIKEAVAIVLQVNVTNLVIADTAKGVTIDVAKEDVNNNTIKVENVSGDAVITGDGEVNGYYDIKLNAVGGYWEIKTLDEETGEETTNKETEARVLKVTKSNPKPSSVIDDSINPKKVGSDFKGWTATENGTEAVDLTQNISDNVEWFAMWEETKTTAPTINTIGVSVSGSAVTTVNVNAENKATVKVTSGSAVSGVISVPGIEETSTVKVSVADTAVSAEVDGTAVTGTVQLDPASVAVGNSFKVTFTPDDSKYDPVEITVTVELASTTN